MVEDRYLPRVDMSKKEINFRCGRDKKSLLSSGIL